MSGPLYTTSTPETSPPNAAEFDVLCDGAIHTFGPCSLTVLAWLPEHGVLKRIWTRNPTMFPNDAEHVIPPDHPLMSSVIKRQESLFVRTADDVKATYVAYEKIFQSGDSCIVNIPVIGASGQTVGTLNFGTVEGTWNDATIKEMQRFISDGGPEAFVKWETRLKADAS